MARQAVAEVLGIDDAATLEAAIHRRGHTLLLELERIIVDPTHTVAERIVAAKVALPFLLPRMDAIARDAQESKGAEDLIELVRQRRQGLAALKQKCLVMTPKENVSRVR